MQSIKQMDNVAVPARVSFAAEWTSQSIEISTPK